MYFSKYSGISPYGHLTSNASHCIRSSVSEFLVRDKQWRNSMTLLNFHDLIFRPFSMTRLDFPPCFSITTIAANRILRSLYIHVNPERSFRGTNDGPSSETKRALEGGVRGSSPRNLKNLHGKWCNLSYC